MSTSRNLQRLFQKRKQKEFEDRKKKFVERYKENVREFKCDFQAKILVVADGRQAIPYNDVVDATEMLENEKKQNEKESNN